MPEDGRRPADSPPIYGGRIPGTDNPAFTLQMPAASPIPVLVAAPHGGRSYPEGVTSAMREPAWSALRLEDRYIDRVAAALARETGAVLLTAQAPRAMLDLNRSDEDVDWGMVTGAKPAAPRNSFANRRARSGLGLVPRRLSGLGELWRRPLTRAELDRRIEGIHRPYHRMLAGQLEHLRDQWGAALLIDLHSMPPLRDGPDGAAGAHFVIGDRFGTSCDARLSSIALEALGGEGGVAVHNRPYSGGYVLDRHAAPSRDIHAMQVEVCRSIYLDRAMREAGPGLPALVGRLARAVRLLAEEIAQIGRGHRLPIAAE